MNATPAVSAEKVGIVWNPSKVEFADLEASWKATIERDAVAHLFETPAAGTKAEPPQALWFETTPEDPGHQATRDALDAGCSLVIAAGGDGTVRVVAGELSAAGLTAAGHDAPVEFGILPLGTGNLLARNLEVPLGDMVAAFSRALTEPARPLDLGNVTITFDGKEPDTQGFVVMVGFGIDAQMIAETDDDLKAKAGWLAYVESLGRAAQSTEVVDFTLSLDGGEAVTESAHTVLVANCGALQGGITLLPDAEPDDGVLDLLVLRADGVGAWLETMRNFVWQNGVKRLLTGASSAESNESTEHLRASSVTIELPHPMTVEVDGDDYDDVTGLAIEVQHAALRVR